MGFFLDAQTFVVDSAPKWENYRMIDIVVFIDLLVPHICRNFQQIVVTMN
jgi:hypothetical protein